METSFIIIISIIAIAQILSLMSVLKFEPIAKAGKVTKFCWRFRLVSPTDMTNVTSDGKPLNIRKYTTLYVCGNSMKDYGIHNGNRVLVNEFTTDGDKASIKDFPVLAFNITGLKAIFQSKYKLRKFISYVNIKDSSSEKWNAIYDEFKDKIKVSKTEFINTCEQKAKKMKAKSCPNNCILSETYDEDNEKYSYSIHPVETMFGKVEYAVA